MRRTITKTFWACGLLAGLSLVASGQISSVTVLADRTTFNNLQWIPLRVAVRGRDVETIRVVLENPPYPAGLSSRDAVPRVKPQGNASSTVAQPANTSTGSVTILLKATDMGSTKLVPIIVRQWGSGREGSESYINVYIQVPVADQIRDDAVEKYFQYLKKRTEANQVKEPGLAKMYASKGGHDFLTTQMKGQYLQNRTGKFMISGNAQYEIKGQQTRTLMISPATIEIGFKGNFFDQPTFRR